MFVDDPAPRSSRPLPSSMTGPRRSSSPSAQRQRPLRSAWQADDAGTEELRVALQQYRTFWNSLEGVEQALLSILKKIRDKAQTAKGAAKLSTGRMTGNRRLRTKGPRRKGSAATSSWPQKRPRTPSSTDLAAMPAPKVACGFG